MQNITIIQSGGTFGYVAFNNLSDEVIVSFRGSENIENWITDFEFNSISYPGVPDAKVHDGFYDAWRDVAASVTSEVTKLLNTSSTIVVTGHSLGAALASFAAVELRNSFTDSDITFYTFGSPRVGN